MKQIKILGIMMVILFVLAIILSSNCVIGHPASNVDLRYDFDNQKLNVTISHNTDDTGTHYIEKIEVYKNGVTIIEEDYTSQSSSNTFTLSFDVSADDGDVLKVETECSLSGKTEDSITVKSEENGTPTKNDDTSTPGFEFLLVFIALVFVFLFKKRIRID